MSGPERINVEELIDVLEAADVLETFCLLPQSDREKFSNWIHKARDNESQWRRVDALVLALKIGPLQPAASPHVGSTAGASG